MSREVQMLKLSKNFPEKKEEENINMYLSGNPPCPTDVPFLHHTNPGQDTFGGFLEPLWNWCIRCPIGEPCILEIDIQVY